MVLCPIIYFTLLGISEVVGPLVTPPLVLRTVKSIEELCQLNEEQDDSMKFASFVSICFKL